MKKHIKMRKTLYSIALCAVLAGISVLLQLIEFPVAFLIPEFVKFDISDLPALIASYGLGPLWGAAVCLVKNLIHLPFGSTGGVGELANLLIGIAFTVPAGVIYRKLHSRRGAFIGGITGSAVAAAVGFPVNLFIAYPFYERFLPIEAILSAYGAIAGRDLTLVQALLIFNLPFTFVRLLITLLVAMAVYKSISPVLHRHSR